MSLRVCADRLFEPVFLSNSIAGGTGGPESPRSPFGLVRPEIASLCNDTMA